jgi:hypothetical protein
MLIGGVGGALEDGCDGVRDAGSGGAVVRFVAGVVDRCSLGGQKGDFKRRLCRSGYHVRTHVLLLVEMGHGTDGSSRRAEQILLDSDEDEDEDDGNSEPHRHRRSDTALPPQHV